MQRPIRILAVDDDSSVLSVVKAALALEGVEVFTAFQRSARGRAAVNGGAAGFTWPVSTIACRRHRSV
jgi:DNA-binding NtrC family response regulator